MRVLIPLVALVASASACTPATATGTQTVCVTFDPYAGETGYYNFDGTGVASPEITVKIGDVITFDQCGDEPRSHDLWPRALCCCC